SAARPSSPCCRTANTSSPSTSVSTTRSERRPSGLASANPSSTDASASRRPPSGGRAPPSGARSRTVYSAARWLTRSSPARVGQEGLHVESRRRLGVLVHEVLADQAIGLVAVAVPERPRHLLRVAPRDDGDAAVVVPHDVDCMASPRARPRGARELLRPVPH